MIPGSLRRAILQQSAAPLQQEFCALGLEYAELYHEEFSPLAGQRGGSGGSRTGISGDLSPDAAGSGSREANGFGWIGPFTGAPRFFSPARPRRW
jgi:hypothetical protein